ncbi:uncharacterized protein TERG_11597 [Trichophyton rubrum CBS 118892]|uniref:Uncharacterized protein n=1 Tax=Trichophyton rubrum (strain ATCC MYA-4607 / CBS 118892) TaxID=559305 RepID=A0A080WGJ7_TRIRC|nr:uncharacterized protein TERG_11597 [Trichophyton rubrum CBS 118892]KFL60299.1 hypothetical protein TERG_11597 [Trichophyton rubrum CBS 118892]
MLSWQQKTNHIRERRFRFILGVRMGVYRCAMERTKIDIRQFAYIICGQWKENIYRRNDTGPPIVGPQSRIDFLRFEVVSSICWSALSRECKEENDAWLVTGTIGEFLCSGWRFV